MLVSTLAEEFVTPAAKENWLSYWKYFSRSTHTKCSVANCSKNHQQGMFVVNQENGKESVFVIPLCQDHGNSETNEIEINDTVELIPIGLTL